MGKTAYITARIEPKLKAQAGRVLAKVRCQHHRRRHHVYAEIVLHEGFPFEVRLPNAESRKAIEELKDPVKRAKLKRCATTDEMFAGVWPKKRVQSKPPA